jgi:HEAT repeat protein
VTETRQHLVDRLRVERDPAVLAQYIHHPAWQVRWEAIKSLGDSASPDAESHLLEVLARNAHPEDFPFTNSALGRVGSRRAVPALSSLIHHRADDVKTSAIWALERLGDSTLTQVYLDALSDRSWAAKAYAMSALAAHGDERAVAAVSERLRSSLSRQRRRNVAGTTEVMLALQYLGRWRESQPVADAAIRWVRTKALARLHPAERSWFETTF